VHDPLIWLYIFESLKLYEKHDATPGIYGSGVMALFQIFSLLSIVMLLSLFINVPLPKDSKILYLSFVLFYGHQLYRYERDFDIKELEAEWEGETPADRKRNGWLIVVSLIFSILSPIVVGILRHNLGL